MKTTNEIKQFFKGKFGIKVRANTSAGKARWQGVWIKSEPGKWNEPLKYTQAFPLEFRISCLKVIYPNSPDCWSGSAGNVSAYSIAMLPDEWETVIAQQLADKT